MTITKNSTITRQDGDLMGGEMGAETVLMNMNTGDYIGLNDVGTDIWKIIEQPTRVSDIISQLMEMYQVDAETCEAGTMKYLEQLDAESMIAIEGE